MGLSCPSLPVVLASPSITGLVPLLKLAHLGHAPPVAQNSTVFFIQQDWGESVCTWKAWI